MLKAIKLTMLNDKSIAINVDDELKHTIPADKRTLTAKDIYEILGFAEGVQYAVEFENEKNLDEQPLAFFYELFSDITKQINDLKIETES